MQIGYSCMELGNALKRLPSWGKHVALGIGLIALPGTLHLESMRTISKPAANRHAQAVVAVRQDARIVRLRTYLASLHCPVADMADDFIHAADENGLDWRLLPSISVIESGGGKAYKNNNIFGWDNGDHLFPTLRSAIHEVAFKLGKSSLYASRNVEQKLHIYNPNEEYAGNVMTVMNRISPVVNLRPASRVAPRTRTVSYVAD